MSWRRGFTLLEMLVALVVTGVVALLVYGAADAAITTQEGLAEHRRALQAETAFRTMLHDALRNAQPARARGDTTFLLEDGWDALGRPRDRLSFVTAGAFPPLTADADWAVTIEPTRAGLVLTAVPIGVAAPPRVVAGPQEITGLDIRIQQPTRERAWLARWRFPSLVPRAIELVYWSDSGPLGAPVRLALPLGGGS